MAAAPAPGAAPRAARGRHRGRPTARRGPGGRRVTLARSGAALVVAVLAAACTAPKSDGRARAAVLAPPAVDPPAPAVYVVRFETTRGPFDVEVQRDWAPRGADRLHSLVRAGYYDGARFYRVVPGFMAQFGFAADPQRTAAWSERALRDDPVLRPNARGTVSFATRGRTRARRSSSSTRTTTRTSIGWASRPSDAWSREWPSSTASTRATARARRPGAARCRTPSRARASATSRARFRGSTSFARRASSARAQHPPQPLHPQPPVR
ncbi:MAG: peptidylprolyl isomerase [Gemmatimonadaceae bacterium]